MATSLASQKSKSTAKQCSKCHHRDDSDDSEEHSIPEGSQSDCADDGNYRTDNGDVELENDDDSPSQDSQVKDKIIEGLTKQKDSYLNDKKKVKKDYESTKVNLQKDIKAFFDAHEDESEAAHNAQLNRLAELLALKASIEAQMTTKLADLRAEYQIHSNELLAAVNSRIKDWK
ncbi:hypothetical protein E8E13_006243 [Curvularia kusanoi]|uniref:Uncharacterized protein n=1 Tax=Curvularia kusanoi TaxID=90978 RepID=A0A9P4TH95_CURKU|nr:hypothetical protein E8E13_006243 [Curvularia kusanoi]